MFVRVVAGCAPCRVAPLAHGATLQRSAAPPFPTGSCDPSGAPKQNTLGALPQDPCRWLCWIRIDFRREPKINPYCAQNRSQGSLRQHLPLPPCFIRHRRRSAPNPPTPFPEAEKGLGWAGKCRAAVRRSGNVRACKNLKPLTHGYG